MATNQTVYLVNPIKIELNSTELNEITNIPEVYGTPSRVDVTRTGSPRKRYIQGQQDTDLCTIEMNYNSVDLATAKAAKTASATAAVPIKLTYPDNTTLSNTVLVSYRFGGGGPDDPLKMFIDCELQADWVEGTVTP